MLVFNNCRLYKVLQRALMILISGVILFGCSFSPKRDPNLPQMPYQEWRIGARHPDYFTAKVFNAYVITQIDEWRRVRIAIARNQNDDIINWRLPNGRVDSLNVYSELPKEISLCWVSFVDQTFYRTKITVPLAIRQKMVVKDSFTIEYSVPRPDEVIEAYYNIIVLGLAPGGNVTAWLTGVPGKETIEFAQVTSQNVGPNSTICPNPYQEGKIPEISDKAKAWLKQYGMPEYWQEPASSTSPQRINHAVR